MTERTFVVESDYYEPLVGGDADKLLFRAGQSISWDTAYEIGLVKTKTPPKAATGKTEKLSAPSDK